MSTSGLPGNSGTESNYLASWSNYQHLQQTHAANYASGANPHPLYNLQGLSSANSPYQQSALFSASQGHPGAGLSGLTSNDPLSVGGVNQSAHALGQYSQQPLAIHSSYHP